MVDWLLVGWFGWLVGWMVEWLVGYAISCGEVCFACCLEVAEGCESRRSLNLSTVRAFALG